MRWRTPAEVSGGVLLHQGPQKTRKRQKDEAKGMGQEGGREVAGVHRSLKNTATDSAAPARKLDSPGARKGEE